MKCCSSWRFGGTSGGRGVLHRVSCLYGPCFESYGRRHCLSCAISRGYFNMSHIERDDLCLLFHAALHVGFAHYWLVRLCAIQSLCLVCHGIFCGSYCSFCVLAEKICVNADRVSVVARLSPGNPDDVFWRQEARRGHFLR